ncbi:MAG: Flp family type IVb pilin [Xanthobacteraceae bacterium]
MKSLLQRFVRDESGATAVEYGLVAAGISVAIIAVLTTLSGQLKNAFSNMTDVLKAGR